MGVIWKAVQRITARPRFCRLPIFDVLTGIGWFQIHTAVWQNASAVFANHSWSGKTVCQNQCKKFVQVSDLDGHSRAVSQGQTVVPRQSIVGGTR